jgi:hypothetical protein
MPSQLVVLDESKSSKHPIISVGGVAVELDRIVEVEAKWAEVKRTAGLGGRSVKYSMSWPERARRGELIGAIGTLPLRAVITLLEDFRPKRMKFSPDKEKRGERYVHLPAFEWVLQRLAEPLYGQPESHPHFVAFDLRDDFAELARGYAKHHGAGWSFGSKVLPSLQSLGYSGTLYGCCQGSLNEIADLLVSAVTRWAGYRCVEHKGGKAPEMEELARDCRAVRDLFPPSPTAIPARWQGYSVITFTQNKTGKELLYDNVDRWLRELPEPDESGSAAGGDDIPF